MAHIYGCLLRASSYSVKIFSTFYTIWKLVTVMIDYFSDTLHQTYNVSNSTMCNFLITLRL
jgi:hypothetical protein